MAEIGDRDHRLRRADGADARRRSPRHRGLPRRRRHRGGGQRGVGRDLGELAGLGALGIMAGDDLARSSPRRRGDRFHRAGRDRRPCREAARAAASRWSSAPPGSSRQHEAASRRRPRRSRSCAAPNMSLGVNLLLGLVRAGRGAAGRRLRHRDAGDAPSRTRSMRPRARRWRWAARRPRGAASISPRTASACATASPARAARRHRLRRAARRRRGRRASSSSSPPRASGSNSRTAPGAGGFSPAARCARRAGRWGEAARALRDEGRARGWS